MLRLNINNKGSLISCTLGFVIPLAKLLAVLYVLWLGEKKAYTRLCIPVKNFVQAMVQ